MNINHQGYSKELKFLKWELPIRQNEPWTSWDGGVGILEFAGGGVLELAPGIWECRFWGDGSMAVVKKLVTWNHVKCTVFHGRFSNQLRDGAQNMNIAMRGLVKHEIHVSVCVYLSFFKVALSISPWMVSTRVPKEGPPQGVIWFSTNPRGSHLQFGSFILWSWMVYIGANHAPWQHGTLVSNLFKPSGSRAWLSSGISSH